MGEFPRYLPYNHMVQEYQYECYKVSFNYKYPRNICNLFCITTKMENLYKVNSSAKTPTKRWTKLLRAEILFVQWSNPPWCKVTFCWMECSLQHSKRNAILQTLFGEFVLPFAHSNRRFQWSSQLSNEHYLPQKQPLPNHKIGLSNQQIGSFW